MVSTKIPLKVQKRSGFDKSHHNALSQKIGTITPILVDELIPNSKVKLRFALAGSLPPLAVDTYMKCYYDVRAFFVPFRLLSGAFESWFADYEFNVLSSFASTTNSIISVKGYLPYFSIDISSVNTANIFGVGTLSDYLGYKDASQTISTPDENVVISAMPFLAYHRICNDWFRQPNITKEYFARPGTSGTYSTLFSRPYGVSASPYFSPENFSNAAIAPTSAYNDSNLLLADGTSIFSLRQANYDYDYFTNGLPSAQLGNPMTVASASSFTIPALRVANSLQQFAELNQIAGSNLVDVVRARYGANLSRGVAQRCIYLGGSRIDIGTKSVDQTTNGVGSAQNPLQGWVGSTGGKAYVQGTDLIVDGFTAQEPGYLFVVGTIIPKVTYGTGVRRYLRHYVSAGSVTDMANPLLQNVGNQPIYDWELTASLGDSAYSSGVFAYTDRYAEFMTMEDEVHGNLVAGQSMGAFVAQRVFAYSDQPGISTSFLSVPTTALDNITALSSATSNYGFYGQIAFDYKVSQPLAQYSLPSLQNPAYEHGETIMVHRGGFRF